ncbi:MAG: 16S rRNA (cytosine(967)-C(5))-methyltransferase RsmB [Clostridia bacterium]|nr:16S rRNA (cytosine(967)-C(5))-methyltransferase RsmB [Clostridia bacterium]
MSVRELSFQTVYDVMYKDKYSNALLEANLNKSNLNERDRNLANNIVMGTLQNYLYLEHVIAKLSDLSYQKLSKSVKVILTISLYQLFFLDKIPEFAICDEAVNLAARYAGNRSKSFVNAILRKAALMKENQSMFLDQLSKKEYLSIKYSFNMNIINQLYKKYGYDKLESMLKAINEYSKTSIRVNNLKADRDELIRDLRCEGFVIDESEHPDCLYISGHANPSHSRLYHEGKFNLMDKGAMELVLPLEPVEDDVILDACASPGGKTTYLSSLMNNKGEIHACDIHESRVSLLQGNIDRMGSKNIITHVKDMTILENEFFEKFDKILLDVPCSGIGVSKKRPEIKLKYEYDETLLKTQKLLLEQSTHYLKKHGRLLYATCTILPCENEMMMDWFLKNYPFKLVKMEFIMPNENSMGFFYSLMEKIND